MLAGREGVLGMTDLKWDQSYQSFRAPTVTSLVKRLGPIGGGAVPAKKPNELRLRTPLLTVRREASGRGDESFSVLECSYMATIA